MPHSDSRGCPTLSYVILAKGQVELAGQTATRCTHGAPTVRQHGQLPSPGASGHSSTSSFLHCPCCCFWLISLLQALNFSVVSPEGRLGLPAAHPSLLVPAMFQMGHQVLASQPGHRPDAPSELQALVSNYPQTPETPCRSLWCHCPLCHQLPFLWLHSLHYELPARSPTCICPCLLQPVTQLCSGPLWDILHTHPHSGPPSFSHSRLLMGPLLRVPPAPATTVIF